MVRIRGRTAEERQFIRLLTKDGARPRAAALLDQAIRKASRTIRGVAPEDVLGRALAHTRPLLEVRKKRAGRITVEVAVPMTIRRGTARAIRVIIDAARSERGTSILDSLAKAIVRAYLGTLDATDRRDVHRMDDPPDPKRRRARRLSARASYGTPG
jgi:ribosomal protein S7